MLRQATGITPRTVMTSAITSMENAGLSITDAGMPAVHTLNISGYTGNASARAIRHLASAPPGIRLT